MSLRTNLAKKPSSTSTQKQSTVTRLRSIQRKHLSVDDITLDELLFSRADGLRQDVIDEYREGLQRGDTFPPITVFQDGESLFLVDGFYRYYSYRLEQIEMIEAEIHEGTLRDALFYSASINQQHGVRRSIRDKRRSVSICLLDDEWSQWSDHTIARHCGVSQPFVSKVRHELVTDNVIIERPNRKRRDKHGNVNSINTRNIGRNRQRPQYTFHTTQLFDHMRQIVQSYELAYPGLQVEYEKQRNGLFIRVVKSKNAPAQMPEDVHKSLEPFINQVLQGNYLDTLATLPNSSIPIIMSDLPYVDPEFRTE